MVTKSLVDHANRPVNSTTPKDHGTDCYCHTCNMTAPEDIHTFRDNPVRFLGYKMGKSGNDGIVLARESPDAMHALSYDSHLGNYKTIEDAKKAAVLYFMLARPEQFAGELASIISDRVRGADLPIDWYRFKDAVKKAGFEMPEELTDGDGKPFACKRYEGATYGGLHLYFNGEPFYGFM